MKTQSLQAENEHLNMLLERSMTFTREITDGYHGLVERGLSACGNALAACDTYEDTCKTYKEACANWEAAFRKQGDALALAMSHRVPMSLALTWAGLAFAGGVLIVSLVWGLH